MAQLGAAPPPGFDPTVAHGGQTIPDGFDPTVAHTYRDPAGEIGVTAPTQWLAYLANHNGGYVEPDSPPPAKDPGFLRQYGAAWDLNIDPYKDALDNTFDQALYSRDVDNTWRSELLTNWEKYRKGYNAEEWELLEESRNQEEFNVIRSRILRDRANQATVWGSGGLRGFGASVLADVTNPVMLAAEAGVGKVLAAPLTAAMRAGNAGKATAMFLGAQAATAASPTAVQAIMSRHVGWEDVAADAAAGLIVGGLFARSVYREATSSYANAWVNKQAMDAAEAQVPRVIQARAELGEAASDDAVLSRVASLEEEGASARVRSIYAAAPDTDIIPARSIDEVAEQLVASPTRVLADGPTSRPSVEVLSPSISQDAVKTIQKLADDFLPGHRIRLETTTNPNLRGGYDRLGDKEHRIRLSPGLDPARAVLTAAHEIGHAVADTFLAKVQPATRQGLRDLYAAWRELYTNPAKGAEAALSRGSLGQMSVPSAGKSLQATLAEADPKFEDYWQHFSEFLADQNAKRTSYEIMTGKGGWDQGVIKTLKSMLQSLWDYFTRAKKDHLLAPDARFEQFLEEVRAFRGDGNAPADIAPELNEGYTQPANAPQRAAAVSTDAMPAGTPAERAEQALVRDITDKATAWVAANPIDPARINSILGSEPLHAAASTGLLLAKSTHPVANMVAGTLLENTTGAAGRRTTAALRKYAHEQAFVGNVINDTTEQFHQWVRQQGVKPLRAKADGLLGGEWRAKFDKLVAEEIEARNYTDGETPGHPAVKRAADSIEAAYERMRVAQTQARTVGFARLPKTARGYMPHALSPQAVMSLTEGQTGVVLRALEEQFQQLEGFDQAFSQNLARRYLDHARISANGGHEIPVNIHDPDSALMVQSALRATGMDEAAVREAMGKFGAGGAGYTKTRLHLDLLRDYPLPDGSMMRLLDLFNTDQLQLLRSYARRASGEVALAQHGVMGAQGLKVLRRAMEFGDHGPLERSTVLEAFDQVAAEFLGRPFESARGIWLNRAITATAAARLGGMVWNQFGESINVLTTLGASHALGQVAGLRRLRAELLASAKGAKVDNPVLSSLELHGGLGEFGSEGYKLVMPFDDPTNVHRTYGADSVTGFDRALRWGAHMQGVATGWRALNAAQVRGVAEQIVLKSTRFVREGLESTALRDMGIDAPLAARIKAELPNIAQFDEAGRVIRLDFTQATDPTVARDWGLAVLRGSRQIIQGTFVGETGKWAHSGWLKMLTQFRTFSITSMEKQWARQRANHGIAGALGILMGSMAVAAPLYYARVLASTAGMEEQARLKALEERLSPLRVARETLNYVALSGMGGDLIDLLSGVGGGVYRSTTGDDVPGWAKVTGGRTGSSELLGDTIAPSIGYANDLFRAMQNVSNPQQLINTLPGSRVWYLVPAINGLAAGIDSGT